MAKKNRLLKNQQKRAKKRVRFLLRHPLLLPVTLFFVVVFFGLGMFVTVGATTQGAQDRRIVSVYVDGEQQTVSTRAKTVGGLLERLDVQILDEDIIEPDPDSIIFEDNTTVNIYRARPVEVVDGERTYTVFSAHRSARLVAHTAGLDLFPEDEADFSRSSEGLLESSAPEQVVVTRSVPVQFIAYGVPTLVRTTASSVEELLIEQGIDTETEATVEPGLDKPIKGNLLVSINQPGVVTDVAVEAIPYETETRDSNSLVVGETQLEREGREGRRTVIYEITQNEEGEETDRQILQAVVTKKPVNEVILRGTKPATLSSSVSVSGDKAALMASAGIAEADYAYVDFIVSKESNWRPGALNAGSGAYGLCQSLPASKMASAGSDYRTNPVTQLRWCTGYATGRYGSWQGAYNAWLAQGWW